MLAVSSAVQTPNSSRTFWTGCQLSSLPHAQGPALFLLPQEPVLVLAVL